MITREEAITTLDTLTSSGVLDEDLCDDLEQIRSCIEAEMIGRHEWGISDELLGVLYTAKRVDLITQEDVDTYGNIHRSLTFAPSMWEKTEIEKNIRKEIEESTGEEP